MEDEPLSLGTFEPGHALEPYLNTPRSLEACRRHGVAPVELVEIPFDEFRKAFPNDADAAQRRYERIDGARRRVLVNVLKEWDQICLEGWTPEIPMIDSTKETIIKVDPAAHSSMLERQAERFRKIERDQWAQMQRMVKLQMSHAVRELANNEIIKQQEAIGAALDDSKKEMARKRDELFQAQIAKKKKEDEDRAIEVRRLQQIEAEEARAVKERKEKKAFEEKRMREHREMERRRREEYTREVKESIKNDFNQRTDAKVADNARRDRERKMRIDDHKAMLAYEKAKKSKVVQDRMSIAQKHLNDLRTTLADEKRKKIEEEEDEWNKKKKKDEEDRLKRGQANNGALKEKLDRIRKQNEDVIQNKIERTKAQMELKEALFAQEQAKMRNEMERRKNIKMIRQEAFELAARRRKKADDHKRATLLAEVKRKDDRYQAMKEGGETLNQMRHVMAEIMDKTKHTLKDGVHDLSHKGILSPSKVVDKVLEVSANVMFPHLSQKFVVTTVPKMDDEELDQLAGTSSSRAMTAPVGKKNSSLGLTDGDFGVSKKKPASSRRSKREKSTHLPLEVLAPHKVAKDVVVTHKQVVEGTIDPTRTASPPKERGVDRHQSIASTMRQQMQATVQSMGGVTPYRPPAPRSVGGDANSIGEGSSRDGEPEVFTPSVNMGTTEVRLQRPIASTVDGKYSVTGKDVAGLFADDKSYGSGDSPMVFDRDSNLNNTGMRSMGPSVDAVYAEATKKEIKKGPDGREWKATPGEFRREYSKDHPLAGGKGKYSKEKRSGKRPVGAGAALNAVKEGKLKTLEKLTVTIDSSDMRTPNQPVDLRRALENLRKDQNEILLRVLDEERKFEEDRVKAGKMAKDISERNRLELVFAEERRRASERIINLTKEHEAKLKLAVVNMKL
jgi:hypothetical protein